MAIIRGFYLPEELYYLVEKHVWIKPVEEGLTRIGMTPVAYALLRHSLVAISVLQKVLGSEAPKGRSVAMVESLKYIGPVPAPFTGTVVRANPVVTAHPARAEADPYGEGWIVEMRPANWEAARLELPTGDAAMAAYRALLESQNMTAE